MYTVYIGIATQIIPWIHFKCPSLIEVPNSSFTMRVIYILLFTHESFHRFQEAI